MNSASTVSTALDKLMENAIRCDSTDYFSYTPDPDWPSPCEPSDSAPGSEFHWQPVRRQEPLDFSGLEAAIGDDLHADIKAYYGSYYSDTIETTSHEGRVSLIQLWSDKDYERLVSNLVGHYLAKKRLRQTFTVFFATTEEDSEMFLSVDNTTGIIYLEEPGRAPLREVETDLASFLNRLTLNI